MSEFPNAYFVGVVTGTIFSSIIIYLNLCLVAVVLRFFDKLSSFDNNHGE